MWSSRGLYGTDVAVTIIFCSPLIAFLLVNNVAWGNETCRELKRFTESVDRELCVAVLVLEGRYCTTFESGPGHQLLISRLIQLLHLSISRKRPVPVAARSKAGSAVDRLLRLCVRILLGAWMFVCCECCVCCAGRGVCGGPITRPEESYRVWYVWVWSWSLTKEEALAHWKLLRYMGGKYLYENTTMLPQSA